MRVAVAGIPKAWSTELLRSALIELGVDSFSFSLADCLNDFRTRSVLLGGLDLGELDGVVVKKLGATSDRITPTRVQLLRQLEHRGVRVFSPANAIAEANDRYWMSQRLAQASILIPRTVVTEDLESAADVVESWGKVVLKPLFTSKGRGMLLLSNDKVYRLKLRNWQREMVSPFYLQEYVPNPGRDIGVAVLAGHVLGAFYRVGSGKGWLTTTSAGGHYESCELTPDMESLAVKAADIMGLDYTVVDLVKTGDGYLVYEVSAFGGFTGLWESLNMNVARLYAEHIIKVLSHTQTLKANRSS